jgi:hypothetical protein
MSKGPPTEPRAPKLGGPERGVLSLGPLGGPFGPLWASLGRLPSAWVAPLPPRGLRGPALVDDLLADNDSKVPVTAEM